MSKWQIKLSTSGFQKLNYYIEEQVAEEYKDPPTERSSVDVWVYDILAKISQQNDNNYSEKDLQFFCMQIYPNLSDSLEKCPKTFQKASEFICNHNLVEWFSI